MYDKKQALKEAIKYFSTLPTGSNVMLDDKQYQVSGVGEGGQVGRFPFADSEVTVGDDKEQALEKAIKYFEVLTPGAKLTLSHNTYVVLSEEHGEVARFPFANLKDGDLCVVSDRYDDNEYRFAIYHRGSFWESWDAFFASVRDEIENAQLEKKTGVNYFDMLGKED